MATRAKLKPQLDLKGLKETREILKKISDNPKFEKAGAEGLVQLHKKLTARAFKDKMDPDSGEKWKEVSPNTVKGGRFKGLLTRSKKLFKAATNPDVSYSSKDGGTVARVKMPSDPFYGEFQQFGTSKVGRSFSPGQHTPEVFVNAKSKRIETAYHRSTNIPARPFFAFAKDNFSNSTVHKDVEKVLKVVFDAVSDSFRKKAISLPAATLEGYTSVVSFYTTGQMSNKISKSKAALTGEGKRGIKGEKLARIDVRTKSKLFSTKGLHVSPDLRHQVEPKLNPVVPSIHRSEPKEPKTGKWAEKYARRKELQRRLEEARENQLVERIFAAKDPERLADLKDKRATLFEEYNLRVTNLLQTLDKLNKQLQELSAREARTGLADPTGRASLTRDIAKINKDIAELQADYALKHAMVFSQNSAGYEGREAAMALSARYNRKMSRLQTQLSNTKSEAVKARIQARMDIVQQKYRREFLAANMKRSDDPLYYDSVRNMITIANKQLEAEYDAKLKALDASGKNSLGFERGGRKTATPAEAVMIRERFLQQKRDAYQASKVVRKEKKITTAGAITRAFNGELLHDELTIKVFYGKGNKGNIKAIAEQRKMAITAYHSGQMKQPAFEAHEEGYKRSVERVRARIKTMQETMDKIRTGEIKKAPKGSKAPKTPAAPKAPKASAAPKAPKERVIKPARPMPTPKPPKTPKSSTPATPQAPKTIAETRAETAAPVKQARVKLSETDKAHNKKIREENAKLTQQLAVFQASGNADLAKHVSELIASKTTQIRKNGTPPPPPTKPKLSAAQKLARPILARRVTLLNKAVNRLEASITNLRNQARQANAAGNIEAQKGFDSRARALNSLQTRIKKVRIPELESSFAKLTDSVTITSVTPLSKHIRNNITTRPKKST